MPSKEPFYNLEKIGGILLFSSAMLAIIIANSDLNAWYQSILSTQASITIGTFELKKPLTLWVNDGLMAIYFLLVGLEIKREALRGILSDKTSIIVPAVTALSGLIVPAIIYCLLNGHNPLFLRGWAIPTATDIAFTLGILALLGNRIPVSLKILLTAIAIFDDIAAIVIIALFYTSKLSYISLVFALIFTLVLIGLNRINCQRLSVYVFFGLCLWVTVLKSGVHATLAGIILAFTIPDNLKDNSPLTRSEQGLHPWCVFLVLPLFAFVNSGVSFSDIGYPMFVHPVMAGVILGLFLGKQIGIFLPLYYFVRFKNYLTYDSISRSHIYGLALLCGVGFTMSLFIGSLAFKGENLYLLEKVKLGVVTASLLSGVLGYITLRLSAQSDAKK